MAERLVPFDPQPVGDANVAMRCYISPNGERFYYKATSEGEGYETQFFHINGDPVDVRNVDGVWCWVFDDEGEAMTDSDQWPESLRIMREQRERIAELEAEVARLCVACDTFEGNSACAARMHTRLIEVTGVVGDAEELLERLRADAERLDWLEDHAISCRLGPLGQDRELCCVDSTVREAIDAARAAGGEQLAGSDEHQSGSVAVKLNRTAGDADKMHTGIETGVAGENPAGAILPPRAVVILVVNGKPEVHYIAESIAREAIERHYAERRIY